MKRFFERYCYWLLGVVFTITVAFNFTKPMGFFRESNAALVCINAKVWQQDKYIKDLHIPVTSYAFDSSTQPARQLYNTCTTFGFAWFAVPYYFFTVTGIPVGHVGLRIFALFWLFFTLFTVWKLASNIVRYYQLNKGIVPLTVWIYALTPAVLWYNIQGYVHEIAILPIYLLAWNSFLTYLQHRKPISLLSTGLLIFIGVQFDWLACMQAAVMFGYFLWHIKKAGHKWAFTVPVAAIGLGLAYIFYTYIHWVGIEAYLGHMQSKFMSRTIGAGKLDIIPFLGHNFNPLLFYAIGFGMFTVLAVIGFIKVKPANPVIWLMVAAAAIHHLVFWGFSTEHDHAAIKMLFPIAFVAATYILSLRTRRVQATITGLALAFNIGLYFLLHNTNYKTGIYSDQQYCYKLGRFAQQASSDPNECMFVDTDNKYYPQIEFYAGRSYIMASSLDEAKSILQKRFPTKTGCFIKPLKGSNTYKVSHFLPEQRPGN